MLRVGLGPGNRPAGSRCELYACGWREFHKKRASGRGDGGPPRRLRGRISCRRGATTFVHRPRAGLRPRRVGHPFGLGGEGPILGLFARAGARRVAFATVRTEGFRLVFLVGVVAEGVAAHRAPPSRRAGAVPNCVARATMAAAAARAAGERGASIAEAGRLRPERRPSATRALMCLQLNLLFW